MKFNIDLSRVGELFYRQVGTSPKTPSLMGFIEDALKEYAKRYLAARVNYGQKQFCYSAANGKASVTLAVYTSKGMPDLSGVALAGTSNDLSGLLRLLEGDIAAEFEGLRLEDIEGEGEELQRKSVREARRKQDYARIGELQLHFTKGQDARILKRIDLNTRAVKLEKKEELMQLAREFLQRADRITVANPFYSRGDSRRELMQEECVIVKREDGSYGWNYTIRSAANEGIPVSILPRLNVLFETIKTDFGEDAFSRVKIAEPAGRGFTDEDV